MACQVQSIQRILQGMATFDIESVFNTCFIFPHENQNVSYDDVNGVFMKLEMDNAVCMKLEDKVTE
jgi:hypothetical protein